MIGQKRIKERIHHMSDVGLFPKVTILYGAKGSGKHLMVDYISKLLGCVKYECGKSIEEVRAIQALAPKLSQDVLIVVYDADDMSIQAQNSLLKLTEEPPKNIYVILTIKNSESLLHTLHTRGSVLLMDKYIMNEIGRYSEKYKEDDNKHTYEMLCTTPSEVDTLHSYGVDDFCNYVQKVIDNIATTSGANAFKIADRIALKNESDKYDLKLFWKCFQMLLRLDKAYSEIPSSNFKAYITTQSYLDKLRAGKLNKQMLFDMWILDMREVWRNE